MTRNLTLHITGQAGYDYKFEILGDTYDVKESIKALGYRWEKGQFGWNPKSQWRKDVKSDDILTEVRKAMELGAVVQSSISDNPRLNNILNSNPLEKIKQAEEMLLAKRSQR